MPGDPRKKEFSEYPLSGAARCGLMSLLQTQKPVRAAKALAAAAKTFMRAASNR
jgi:hypothetical protein